MGQEVRSGKPSEFSEKQRITFIEIVRAGSEVSNANIERNVANAEALVSIGRGPNAIAVLKNPLASYRKRIGESSGFTLDLENFPFELGYVFVTPKARGQGLSHTLVNEAIRLAAGRGIFATARVDNGAMHAVLVRVGFEAKGSAYGGRSPARRIQIFVKPGQPKIG